MIERLSRASGRALRMMPIALVLIAALAPAGSVRAQGSFGSLTVHVIDSDDGQPVPGATVVLSSDLSLVAETAQLTDAQGTVRFPILSPGGGYLVQVTMPGFATVRQSDLRVRIRENSSVVIQLGAELVESIEVAARGEVVDLEQSAQATTFDETFIDNLPILGRFYTNVLTLAPGVQDADADGNPNVHGARERDFQAQVGGVSNVDPLTGLRLSNVNIDAIEEIEVLTAGAGVEYGRAQGGFASIVEKQGSNSFEGLFSFIYRTDKLDGNGASGADRDEVPEFEWVQPALVLSGPIIRDKLWYFLANEHVKRQDPVNILDGIAVSTTEQSTGTNRITWQASRRNKLAFTYLYDPLTTDNIGISSTLPAESTISVGFGGPTYRLNWTAPYSPRLLFDSVLAYQDIEQTIGPTSPGVANNCVVGVIGLELGQCENITTGRTSGSYFLDHEDKRQRFTLKSQASMFGRWLGMDHQLKLGISIENERYFRKLERRALVSFTEVRPMAAGAETFGRVSARVGVPGGSVSEGTGAAWAFFAEDQFKPASNLTITLGARIDREETRSEGFVPFDPAGELRHILDVALPILEEEGIAGLNTGIVRTTANQTFTAYADVPQFKQQLGDVFGLPPDVRLAGPAMTDSTFWANTRRVANVNLSTTNLSPFFSLAWDPFKTGKTKIAVSARRYYDKLILAIPLVEQEPVTTDVNFIALLNRDNQWETLLPSQVSPNINIGAVDREIDTPYQDEFTFTVERELTVETALKFTYIKRKFRDQLQDTDINHLPQDFGFCRIATARESTNLVFSPGSGQLVTDPVTGEKYEDTDPGIGDGRLDNCIGETETIDDEVRVIQRPDDRVDLYVQNPGWGDIFLVGNFNSADYEAYVLELTRRQYRNWQMNGSYVYSKATGDAEDYNLFLGNDRTLLDDERGFLSYDQRHVVKVNAVTILPWAGGIRFGTAVQWQSGLPYSIVETDLSFAALPPFISLGSPEPAARLQYPTGQRNDQRNQGYWNFDLHLAKDFSMRGGVNLQLSVDVFNLLNDNTLRILDNTDGVNGSVRRFGRRFQLGLRLAF